MFLIIWFVPLVAFLFNWIGFCLSFCLTNTIAGRYGAICGFGLSLIKWILIVRVSLGLLQDGHVNFQVLSQWPIKTPILSVQFSDYFTGYFNGQYWLWWIFLLLGECSHITSFFYIFSHLCSFKSNQTVCFPLQASCCSSEGSWTIWKSATCLRTWPRLTERASSSSTNGTVRLQPLGIEPMRAAALCNDWVSFSSGFLPKDKFYSSPSYDLTEEPKQWREISEGRSGQEVLPVIISITQLASEASISHLGWQVPGTFFFF